MHMAAANGNLAQLNLVVEFAPERINETNRYGETPLHCAARSDQEAAVSLLLSAKADVNATDSNGGHHSTMLQAVIRRPLSAFYSLPKRM